MAKLKILQVGIGGYGEAYLRPMLENLQNGRYELAGVVDPMADRSPLYGQLAAGGIPVHASVEDFYAGNRADLTIVAAPISFHRFYTVYALEHGSHVLCEKPTSATLEDAEAMGEAEQRTSRFVAIGFQWSFSQAMLAAKRDYLDGRFGRPVLFKSNVLWSRNWQYYARNNWAGRLRDRRGNWVLDSVAHNATAHYLHSLYFMHGAALNRSARPTALQAELYRANDIENFDTCALRAKTDEGCEVLFNASHAVECQGNPVMEYRYERATLAYNSKPGLPENRLTAVFPDGTTRDYGAVDSGTEEKLESCLDAIETGAPVPCGIETAMPHLFTVNFLADNFAVRPFPRESVVADGALEKTYVPGLDDALRQCFAEEKLPHELGCPWAAPAAEEETAGYGQFTGRLFTGLSD